LVIAVLGATFYGLSNNSSGLSVNGSALSSSTFRSELVAITSNPTLACYVAALDPTSFAPGAGGASMSAAGAAAWANFRVEGIAIDQYATTSLKFHPDAATLAKAQTSLESELNGASQNQSTPCSGTAAQALAAMPAEMRTFEIASQAASLDLVAKLNTTIPLTVTSMKQYYTSHTSDYDTLCVSVAVVDPAEVTAFSRAQSSGMSVADLARKFSIDQASSAKGGAYGCFGPSSQSYAGVRAAVQSVPLNTFSTAPEGINYNGSEAALFVAPTKRTTTLFAQAETTVLSDLENANATAANTQRAVILGNSTVAVDPSFGRWSESSSGPEVVAPAAPPSAVVGSTTVSNLSVGASTYK
jgi:hypothetical protein